MREQFRRMRNEMRQDFADRLGEKMLQSELFYWTTKEGRKLFIADMTDKHLANCLRALERDGASNPFIAYELARRAYFKKGDNNDKG